MAALAARIDGLLRRTLMCQAWETGALRRIGFNDRPNTSLQDRSEWNGHSRGDLGAVGVSGGEKSIRDSRLDASL